jgi:ElaB/YqjD/DUF883 family membrane-anchored ribosome-binding protein
MRQIHPRATNQTAVSRIIRRLLKETKAKPLRFEVIIKRRNLMAQSTYGHPSDRISDLKEKAIDQFGKAADDAEDMAKRVAERGREATEQMREVTGNFKGAVDKSVKDQPMVTLAMAAVVGFVLGALWKS